MNPRTLADVYVDIRMLGRIVGRAKAGETLVRKMQREFAEIERQSRRRKTKLRVYCEAWPNPRISSPPWVRELVNLCGCEMVVRGGEKISDEQVAASTPDVIVLAWAATGDKANPNKAYEVPTWQEVPAIRNRRVHVISDELLNTPGPPLVHGAKELYKLLHSKGKEKDNAEMERTQRFAEK
jgi:iron complex transport system substrate-binding protein